ncbi:hypothetical protein GCK72_007343 [Caenorhabditis remanei]|uniref:Uncharacterized protein n=1 Tax=Caenorhabditis remanei TaxID=31234 RepID=A0A6A5HL96_CAERE|nr:hypothetical protein GCK72_007343 [Caenorhabditis remanei]KAF1767384.1 hypothetical protein GCK72_007343 [Caenorhabditis remanei]
MVSKHQRRIKISQRLPTISSTEKLVPLRIRYLTLSSTGTSINDTKYFVGVYRVFQPDEIIPKSVQDKNDSGGVPYDLDQYGFQAPLSYILEAGDVPLKELNNEPFRHDTDGIEEREKRNLRNYEAALALKIKSMGTEATVEELPENDNQDIANNDWIRQLANYLIESLNELILLTRHALLPFHYRRHNLSPPYTCYIQLTVACKGTKPKIQRYKYTKSLHEAAKQLNTILFGGRQCVIQVRDFKMPWYSILRLPVGFKIRVKCIDNLYDLSLKYNAMLSMIESSSFPLDKATIFAEIDITVNDFHLPAIRSAKKEKTVKELLKWIKTRMENPKRTKRCVTVCMGHSNRLEIYYVPAKTHSNPEFDCLGYEWVLTMRIVRVR